MHIENTADQGVRTGWIEVICGSMFSGKTEELLRRLRRAIIARQEVKIFKPGMENRYSATDVVSHDSNSMQSIVVDLSADIIDLTGDAGVIAIDEAQFFDDSLPFVCNHLANSGKRVIVAGFDMDFRGQPFGPLPAVMAIAERISKLHAICLKCGSPAYISHRTTQLDQLVLLGEKEHYEPLCRNCYVQEVDYNRKVTSRMKTKKK